MNIQDETDYYRRSIPRKNQRNDGNKRKLLYFLLTFFVWAGLLYGGYYLANDYFEKVHANFDTQIQEIKQHNEEISSQLERFNQELGTSTEELKIITNELNYIKEALEITGETITGSDQTRVALQEKMTELDKRLNQLTAQLIKLEEAARAH